MKLFVALSLLFAVASASVLPAAVIASENPEIQEIVAAIQSPSTDPATAVALEQMLLDILGLSKPEPIDVGPAIVDNYEPISIGPAIVDFPLPDGGAVTDVEPSPASPSPSSSPLVQIIIKINQALADAIGGSPVVVETVNPPAQQIPDPVAVVDKPIIPEPVIVVDKPAVPEPVIVVDKPIIAEPVTVVEKPEAPESVIVAQPIFPDPAIVLPEILN
ncbi:unnamed protein product [Parnassius apollo]|uniref:(apollo) hypothetical protein n=1 Tax=Parnassius apollo TaxID=110799 RepID=A0A8S3XLC2_PARAO|nr:unnamed protein product [Parnassius apollo]